MLCLAPTEVLIVGDLSAQTQRMLDFITINNSSHKGRSHEERIPYSEIHGKSAAIVTKALSEIMPTSTDEDESGDGVDTRLSAEILELPELIIAGLAGCIKYLEQLKLQRIIQLGRIRCFEVNSRMNLTPNTLRQLEILQNSVDGASKGSLFALMNGTSTAFGARLMREWITNPLRQITKIRERQEAVQALLDAWKSPNQKGSNLYYSLIGALSQVPDVERGLMRIFHKTATPKEFVSVLEAILQTGRKLETLGIGRGSSDSKGGSNLLSLLLSQASSDELLQTTMVRLCAFATWGCLH